MLLIDCSKVNWPLLREQKADFLEALALMEQNYMTTAELDRSMRGILHLLDDLQDKAAFALGAAVVFGEGSK